MIEKIGRKHYQQIIQTLVKSHANVFDPTFTASLLHEAYEATGSMKCAVTIVNNAGREARQIRHRFS